MPKVYKKLIDLTNETLAFYTILSCINSLPEIFSKWVDHQLKLITTSIIPMWIKDSNHIQEILLQQYLFGLPLRAKLFQSMQSECIQKLAHIML